MPPTRTTSSISAASMPLACITSLVIAIVRSTSGAISSSKRSRVSCTRRSRLGSRVSSRTSIIVSVSTESARFAWSAASRSLAICCASGSNVWSA